ETEKLRVMESFLSMDTKLIVSTTVIEVGVDNPNAIVMIIYDSENFGLSTLHQLRGRVGRGDKKSICLLVSQTKSQLACQRLELMCHSSDGFDLANKDLELRGPGDFFGTRQHGIPTLRAANLFTDASLAKIACDSVNEVLKKDDEEASKLKETINMAFKMRFANKINAL
ncbi:MAG TPA: helicase-related protein, partial [Saccharofermentans sp.]|nr:helicase-related protein [Saccharofermentans sp.]